MKLNLIVTEIDRKLATHFVEKTHYSPIMPRLTRHFLGFYQENELKGVLTLGWGTRPRHTIQKLFPSLNTDDYFEIGKMCMGDEMPRNSESQMVAQTVKWLKQYHPSRIFLYTMADGIMGKCGYVYQASNFYYGGQYLTMVYLMPNGEKLHPRSTKKLLIENQEFSGQKKLHWMTRDFMNHKGIRLIEGQMFRYIYPLNKTAKRMMEKESTTEWTKNYPKDHDLIWYDKTTLPKQVIPKPDFTYENMEFNPQAQKSSEINLLEFFN